MKSPAKKTKDGYMDKTSQLDCYLYFMWNDWDKDKCLKMFGMDMGEHIWAKWRSSLCNCGIGGAPSAFYSSLDADRRKAIVAAAVAHYNPEG